MIIDSIEEQLRSRKRGITMMIIKNDLLLGLNEIDYEKYSGMILIGTEMIDDDYNCLKDIPIPFVVVDNAVPNIMCSSVSINNYENVYIAISYLKEAGHNRIGYIGSKSETENFRERRTAFELTVKKLNMEMDEENDYKVTPTLIGSHDDFLEILEKKDLNKFYGKTLSDYVREEFETFEKISIDFGVMEHTKSVLVIPVDISWNDVGSFKSLDEIFPKDKKGNVIRAEKYSEIDSEGNIIINKEKGKIIATIGIEDIVIVNTEDALLVCHKDKSQEIKKILNKIEKENK